MILINAKIIIIWRLNIFFTFFTILPTFCMSLMMIMSGTKKISVMICITTICCLAKDLTPMHIITNPMTTTQGFCQLVFCAATKTALFFDTDFFRLPMVYYNLCSHQLTKTVGLFFIFALACSSLSLLVLACPCVLLILTCSCLFFKLGLNKLAVIYQLSALPSCHYQIRSSIAVL